MTQKSLQIVAIIAGVVLVATLSYTVIATGDGSAEQEGVLVRNLHKLGHHLHGGHHHQDPMAELIEQLELTPDQLQRLEAIHEIIETHGAEGHGSMEVLHEHLMAQFEQGRLDNDEIRGVVDSHVEQIRRMAYAVTDELVALVNGMDEKQREIVMAHVEEIHAGQSGYGH